MTRPTWAHRFTQSELRSRLTGGELQLLRLIERDFTNKDIASHLGISEDEVNRRMVSLHTAMGLDPSDRPTWLERQGAQTGTTSA